MNTMADAQDPRYLSRLPILTGGQPGRPILVLPLLVPFRQLPLVESTLAGVLVFKVSKNLYHRHTHETPTRVARSA